MKFSNKRIVFIFIFFIISIFLYGKEYSFQTKIPDWVINNKIEIPGEMPDNLTNGIYYLLFDKQINRLNDKNTFYSKVGIKIVENQGVGIVSQVNIDYDPSYEHITIHSVNIIRGDKIINKIKTSKISVLQRELELSYQIYDGTKTINIILDDVRIDDIIEYSYSITGSNPVFQNKYCDTYDLQWSIPVKKAYYRLLFPDDKKIYFKKYNTDKKYIQNKHPGYTEYIWEEEKIEAVNYDDNIPYWYFPYNYIQISEYETWNEIVEWGIELFNVNDNIEKIIDNFYYLKFNYSKYQQIVQVLRFVQDEIRYMGIEMGKSAYTPKKPSVIYSQRFGDCKDKALLMVSILNNMGIEAYPAFVNTYLDIKITEYLPSPVLFNHVIVLVRLENKNIWLDPTLNHQKGNIGYFDQPYYGYALVLSKKYPDLVKMNPINRIKPSKEILEEFTISNLKDNKASLLVKSVLKMNEADYLRSAVVSSGESQLKKDYLNYYANYYNDIKNTDFELTDNPDLNKIETKEAYEITNIYYYDEDQKKYFIQFSPGDIRTYLVNPNVKKRNMPLNLYHPINISYNYHINLPDLHWKIKNEEKIVENSFVYFRRSIKLDKNKKKMIINFNYKTLKNHVNVSEMDVYIKDIDKVFDLLTVNVFKKHYDAVLIKARIYLIITIIVCIVTFLLIIRAINPAFLVNIFKKIIMIFKQ